MVRSCALLLVVRGFSLQEVTNAKQAPCSLPGRAAFRNFREGPILLDWLQFQVALPVGFKMKHRTCKEHRASTNIPRTRNRSPQMVGWFRLEYQPKRVSMVFLKSVCCKGGGSTFFRFSYCFPFKAANKGTNSEKRRAHIRHPKWHCQAGGRPTGTKAGESMQRALTLARWAVVKFGTVFCEF